MGDYDTYLVVQSAHIQVIINLPRALDNTINKVQVL